MVVEFEEDGVDGGVGVVFPNYETIAIGAHGVTHEAVFKEVAVPLVALLGDDAGLHLFDERAEEGFATALGNRIGGPFAESGVGELTEGGAFPRAIWLSEQRHKTCSLQMVGERDASKFQSLIR